MMISRDKTRQISVGGVKIGGGALVPVQSMCTTKTKDTKATIKQILGLYEAGCEIIRLAVPDMESASALSEIKANSPIPIVADIHFDYRLALAAAENGASKIRINPGNIGDKSKVHEVAKQCKARGIPIRIGVNSGSVPKSVLEKHKGPTPQALIESAKIHAGLLEEFDFEDICLSLKSSSVTDTIKAYKLAAETFKYPLHIGVTESGTVYNGVIRSAVGIGTLLCMGIGDTLRVSLTADPEEEVKAGIAILKAADLRKAGPRLISCPTCGRTEIDLISLAREVESRLDGINRNITVAVMGCVVNGPGEAKEADYGIAGGKDCGLLFKKGEAVAKLPVSELSDALFELIESEREI